MMISGLQRFLLATALLLLPFSVYGSNNDTLTLEEPPIKPRARIIIDNDFGGDPDGLWQLAHHLLSPSVSVVGVIASKHYDSGFYGDPGTAKYAAQKAQELLQIISPATPLFTSAEQPLKNQRTPHSNPAVEFIVREAMRDDTDLPLYVVCGAGLSAIASAYLTEPKIANRLQLIWIGGPEYDATPAPPQSQGVEYNTGIDLVAAQVVFNQSALPLWQVPRNSYRQTLVSIRELQHRMATQGALSKYLLEQLTGLLAKAKGTLGEAYAMGDSPLVLLTALQSAWQPDASSSSYRERPAPRFNAAGDYQYSRKGRAIRVYQHIDTRLMMEDFYAKVQLFDASHSPTP